MVKNREMDRMGGASDRNVGNRVERGWNDLKTDVKSWWQRNVKGSDFNEREFEGYRSHRQDIPHYLTERSGRAENEVNRDWDLIQRGEWGGERERL